jgi:peptide-methionine (S)-S-oxide reductase
MALFNRHKAEMVGAEDALPGRPEEMPVPAEHFVNGHALKPPFPEGLRTAVFALGCFWGEERKFWETAGVWSTAVGYSGGFTPNPTYEETCTGRTGHAESVLVVFDPAVVTYEQLLTVFWEAHDPTQGMRQGNDIGTTYRSAVFYHSPEQEKQARESLAGYQERLTAAGYPTITTEVAPASEFYFAEDYHQQYLKKNPYGYCPDHGTGVSCPVGVGVISGTGVSADPADS